MFSGARRRNNLVVPNVGAWATFLALLQPIGCSSGAELPDMPLRVMRAVVHEPLGVRLEVPAPWIQTVEGTALVFSGPEGSDSYYTTLVLQGVPKSSATLQDVLEASHASIVRDQGARWTWREPTTVAGRPAFRYALTLELHETPRHKVGVLVDADAGVLDLSYAAPTKLFHLSVDVFEQVVDTLEVFVPADE